MQAGTIVPGDEINEMELAAELGVSRTPLREALIALETQGQVRSEHGRGFRFAPLSAREFEELGPVISTLESLALDLTPVDALMEIGGKLADLAAEFAEDSAQHDLVMRRDVEWHNLMISGCHNSHLIDVIDGLRLAIHRYESLLMPDEVRVLRVSQEHSQIARHLIAGRVPEAIAALEVNWLNGIRRLLENPHIRLGT